MGYALFSICKSQAYVIAGYSLLSQIGGDLSRLVFIVFGLQFGVSSYLRFQVSPPTLKLPPSLLIRATEDRSVDKWFRVLVIMSWVIS